MVLRIRDAPTAAGVVCPKKTGKMDKSASCRECRHWLRCMNGIMGALGAEG